MRGLIDAHGRTTPLDTLLLQRSARWLVARRRSRTTGGAARRAGRCAGRGSVAPACSTTARPWPSTPRPHGAGGLGAMFWLAVTLALLLYLVTMVVLLVRPETAQRAVRGDGPGTGRQPALPGRRVDPGPGLAVRLHALGSRPALCARPGHRRRPGARHRHASAPHAGQPRVAHSRCGWRSACSAAAVLGRQLSNSWWWTQAVMIGCGVLAVAQLGWAQRAQPAPAGRRAAALLRPDGRHAAAADGVDRGRRAASRHPGPGRRHRRRRVGRVRRRDAADAAVPGPHRSS